MHTLVSITSLHTFKSLESQNETIIFWVSFLTIFFI